jgi:multicomponent Na+:H+ antiporter subunit E
MARFRSQILTFIISYLIWWLLTLNPEPASLLIGLLVALFVASTSGHLFSDYPHKWAQPQRYLYFLLYLWIFFIECIRSNLDVAMRVIQPEMPINPGIVKIKTRLKSEVALTFLANSITLTPGTISVDVDEDKGILYIHWIDVKDEDLVRATNLIAKKFEDIIEKVFE